MWTLSTVVSFASTKTTVFWPPHLMHVHLIQKMGWFGPPFHCALQLGIRMNPWAMIWRPCAMMAHDLELLFVHFANVVCTINWIDVNSSIDALIEATRNYMTIRISVCLKFATFFILTLKSWPSSWILKLSCLFYKWNDAHISRCLLVFSQSCHDSFWENISCSSSGISLLIFPSK